MEVTLQNTSAILQHNGVAQRVWKGTTDTGITVYAFITGIYPINPKAQVPLASQMETCIDLPHEFAVHPDQLII